MTNYFLSQSTYAQKKSKEPGNKKADLWPLVNVPIFSPFFTLTTEYKNFYINKTMAV